MTAAKPAARPLRYLALEGGVIVVSILLAFGLDALWDASKRESEAQLALVSLQDEFEANLSACEQVQEHHFAKADHFARVLAMPEAEVLAMTDEEATAAYYAFCSPRSFDALLGTTNSVINTGTFSILQDAALRKELDVFLNLMDDTQEDIQNMLHFMRAVGEHEVRLGGPWGDPEAGDAPDERTPNSSYLQRMTARTLAALMRDKDYMGHVKLYHGCAGWYASEVTRLADQIRELLRMIRAQQT